MGFFLQATHVAAASTESAEDLTQIAMQEEAITMVELGVVVDVDIAHVIYFIPEEGEVETPTVEYDEAMQDESDSDVNIEPYVVGWKHYGVTEALFPDLVRQGEPYIPSKP